MTTLNATGKNGKQVVSAPKNGGLVEHINKAIKAVGGNGLTPAIILPAAVVDSSPKLRAAAVVSSSPKLGAAPNVYVPKWIPAPDDNIAPTRFPAQDVIISTAPVAAYCWAFSMDFGAPFMVNPTDFEAKGCTFTPEFPAGAQLQVSAYWQRVYSVKLDGPQTFKKTVIRSSGSSVTDSTALSSELGVTYGGLSAKISSTTSHAVTITEQATVSDDYTVPVDAGVSTNWNLWQLVETYTIVDASGNPLTYSGLLTIPSGNRIYYAQIQFTAASVQNNTGNLYSAQG